MNTVKVSITGPPGSGRSQVAKILIAALEANGIDYDCPALDTSPPIALVGKVEIEEFTPRGQM